jgi:helix-turn-helix protein
MMQNIPELLTARDVQKILKCSLPLIYKLAERNQIPCVRWEAPGSGTRKKTVIRFKLEDVQKFIEGSYSG